MNLSWKVLLGALVLGLGMAGRSEAAGATRGAKAVATLTYTTTVSTVSLGASVLYAVTLSTGASGEYVAFFDTSTATGITSTLSTAPLKTRVFFGSTTANTVVNFDPPLQFNNGIVAVDSAITGQSAITYERGRVVSGY